MVSAIRNRKFQLVMGRKGPTKSELKNRMAARKSIVASRLIKVGEKFTESNIDVKRQAFISPMDWDNVIGRKATRDFVADEMIERYSLYIITTANQKMTDPVKELAK